MAILYMVRHGQASFHAADYDVLSPLGERQSRRVGERIARAQPRLRALYSGPRRRQIDTARWLREAALAAGADVPEVIVRHDFDELPVRDLLMPVVAEVMEARAAGQDAVLALIMREVRRWAEGELVLPGVLSPPEFVARVERALDEVTPRDDGAAVVVTSGGPLAVPLLRGAHLKLEGALSDSLSLANTALIELRRTDAGLRLEPGDPVAHLPPDEITPV
jgi:broad specificity phosphatase PhoE